MIQSLPAAIRDCITSALEAERVIEPEALVEAVMAGNPDLIRAESERLIVDSIRKRVRRALKDMSEDDDSGQLSFPGLSLPAVITIPAENASGFVCLRTDKATFAEIEAGELVRSRPPPSSSTPRNVDRARRRLRTYRAAVKVLRPIMENDPTMTVAEAVVILAGQAVAS